MTVEAQNPDGTPIVRSGPYNGNGVTVAFDYDFPVTAETEVKVLRQNADLTEDILEITTDYTVSGAGSPAGGAITLTSAALLPTGTRLVLLLDMPFNQTSDYSNQGRIQLALLEVSLDRLTLICRQLREEMLRAVTVDAFNTTDISTLRTNIAALALIEAEIAAVAGSIASVTIVAGISASVTTVAGIAAAVSTVAGIAAAVSTVSTNIAAINTNATNIVAIQGAAAAAAAAAVSAGEAAASAALAATFNPALYVTKASFLTDVAASVTTAAETIAANDNDTTLPTSAAVVDYVAAQLAGYAPPGYAEVPGSPFTVSGASPYTVTGLGGYKDILVIGDLITATVAGQRAIRVGKSGTGILSTSIYAQAGFGADTSHRVSDSTTSARSFLYEVLGFNSALAAKPVRLTADLGNLGATMIKDASVFDRVQVLNSVGATLGGTLRIFGRA